MAFRFNFNNEASEGVSDLGKNEADQSLVVSEEVLFPATAKANTLTWDSVSVTDTVTLLKGRMNTAEASRVLNQDGVLQNDLIPGKYEGGFKLWEGSVDLSSFLARAVFHQPCTAATRVLELGCGHGLPGILAMLQGATVDFQDYNREVIELLTIPCVMTNWRAAGEKYVSVPPVRFFYGDWGTTGSLLRNLGLAGSYDYIFTSETIYALESMGRLLDCFKQCLKRPNGVGFVSAKSFYFGVGGSVAQFVMLVDKDPEISCEVVEVLEDGLSNRREILALKWL